MKPEKLFGPFVLFIVFAICITAASVVLAVEPAPPSPPLQPIQSVQPVAAVQSHHPTKAANAAEQQSDGALRIVNKDGAGEFCPLKHTSVSAEISGFLARVSVTQEFTNPSTDKVEAIYTFPLPQNAAINDMTMTVGGRTIKGLIKKREEAQQIYTRAVQAGHTAALLDQERPNIFTQSVGNIPPGGSVKVEISYIETLDYDDGAYNFVYPMVVGPRYIPGQPVLADRSTRGDGGWSADTDQVPDASRITPPVAGVHYGKKGTRAGHDISLAVKLDAGVTIKQIDSPTHTIDSHQPNVHAAEVKVRNEREIPNKDFVLRYEVAGSKIEDALLMTSRVKDSADDKRGGGIAGTDGYFVFILQPPDRVRDEDAGARELIFVLDTSGSMSGYPIETAKKVMKRAIESLRPQDTFNLVTFAGDTHVLFPQPVPSSAANIAQATAFLSGQRGGGGTEMMKAIKVALGDDGSGVAECKPYQDCAVTPLRTPAVNPLRIVCFMTDGYVGNDMAIIGEIQKHNARVFSFGIGSSVNRFLLDKMAEAGRGEVEYVLNEEAAASAADRFYERVHTPVLTDITVDWNGLPVSEVMPQRPLDLFTAKPLVVSGRFTQPAKGSVILRGKRAGKAFERAIKVDFASAGGANQALAQLWARKKIDELMSADWAGMQQGNPKTALRDEITQLGLDYRLMTQFTSFVAVEEQKVVEGGRTRTVQVPVEMPHNVSPEGVFGATSEVMVMANGAYPAVPPMAKMQAYGGRGAGAGVAGGVTMTDAVSVAGAEAPREMRQKRTDEQEKDVAQKLHSSALKAYQCWKSGNRNCAGVKDGKVVVDVWLEQTASQPLLNELARVGLVGERQSTMVIAALAKSVRGTIAVEKLPELAKLAGVRLVSLAK